METLQQGELAPDFVMPTMNGEDVRLTDYQGKKVLLTFFRYATCPFCTIRFAQLSQKVQHYSELGVEVIGVFESSHDTIQKYLSRRGLPFTVIHDHQGELYARYGVKKSIPGLLFGMFRMPTLLKALFDPQYQMAKPDGSISRIPADFLIDENQFIEAAYFGSDIGDHIPFKKIDAFAERAPIKDTPLTDLMKMRLRGGIT